MFISTDKFPFLAEVASSTETIYEELRNALQRDADIRNAMEGTMFMDFPSNQWAWENGVNQESVGYDLRDGNYSMLAIYKKKDDAVTIDRSDLFPKTMSLLSSFESPYYIAFTFLHPGSHLKPHKHTRSHYVYHLLLKDLQDGDCKMICGNEKKYMKKAGDHLLFDYSLMHETFHRASNLRIHLVVDFRPTRRV